MHVFEDRIVGQISSVSPAACRLPRRSLGKAGLLRPGVLPVFNPACQSTMSGVGDRAVRQMGGNGELAHENLLQL